MLKSLQVKNFVLIDSLEINFPAGLSIITGQTGAGKSILLGAISLVLGSKADASMVGESGDTCVVEAEFEMDDDSVRAAVEEEGLEWDGGSLVVRRVLNRSGRSRSFINDEPVQVGVLSRISSHLIDIHSQHQTLLLNNKAYQLSMLDHYAGNAALLEACRECYTRLNSRERELSELKSQIDTIAQQSEYNEARFRQLDQAKLAEGELEELEAEQKRLANAEEIRQNLFEAEDILSPQDDERRPLDSMLKDVVRFLERAGKYVEGASQIASRVESSRLELDDVLSEIQAVSSTVDVAPDRLETVESRMSLLYELMRKFGCSDVASLIAERDRLGGLVTGSEVLEERYHDLEKLIAEDRAELDNIAGRLHESRSMSMVPFAAAIQDSVRSLEMEQAVFQVVLSETEVSASGKDGITFLFSASGRNPVDVSKCASGGEMSRIMLCLKAMMARYTNMPTMVFDEIDTGVSGSVADKMGSMICSMGADMQVFAITHLPQVAAKGDAHYLVSKTVAQDGKATTAINQLSGDDRVMELARMLSGSVITPEAIANAKSLIS